MHTTATFKELNETRLRVALMPSNDSPQMTPRLCMAGIVAVFVATMVGVANTHDKIESVMVVVGFGTTLTAQLFSIMQQFSTAKKQETKAEEVKQAVVVSDIQKAEKLNHIAETVVKVAEVVVAVEKNTNGALTDKLKNIADDVKTTIKQNETLLGTEPKATTP